MKVLGWTEGRSEDKRRIVELDDDEHDALWTLTEGGSRPVDRSMLGLVTRALYLAGSLADALGKKLVDKDPEPPAASSCTCPGGCILRASCPRYLDHIREAGP